MDIHELCMYCGSGEVKLISKGKSEISSTSTFSLNAQNNIQCQACQHISLNSNQPIPRLTGFQSNYTELSKDQVRDMMDELLTSLSASPLCDELQAILKQCCGDVFAIVHLYMPRILTEITRIIGKYYFEENTQGILACFQIFQTFALSDGQLKQDIITLHKHITPTGAWIAELEKAQAEILLQKKLLLDEKMRQDQVSMGLEDFDVETETKDCAQAKKLSTVACPDTLTQPIILHNPPRMIMAPQCSRVTIKVAAMHADSYSWYLNGEPLTFERFDNQNLGTGSNKPELTFFSLCPQVLGDYFCVCVNGEGSIKSQICRVCFIKLQSRLVHTRSFIQPHYITPTFESNIGSQASSSNQLDARESVQSRTTMYYTSNTANRKSCTRVSMQNSLPIPVSFAAPSFILHYIIACDAIRQTWRSFLAIGYQSSLFFLDAKSLTVIYTSNEIIGSTKLSIRSIAWAEDGNMLATLVTLPPQQPEKPWWSISFYRIYFPHKVSASKCQQLDVSESRVNLISSTDRNPCPQKLKSMEWISFLCLGKFLAISDLKHSIILASIILEKKEEGISGDSKLVISWDHTITFMAYIKICHISVAMKRPLLVVCFYMQTYIQLVETYEPNEHTEAKVKSSSRLHEFDFPIVCTAIDQFGLNLAVAESNGRKSWIILRSTSFRMLPKTRKKIRVFAHIGKISGLQWTENSMLLVSCGYDGYVKIWDLLWNYNNIKHSNSFFNSRQTSQENGNCLFQIHCDNHGVHKFLLTKQTPTNIESTDEDNDEVYLHVWGYSDKKLSCYKIKYLNVLESSRISQINTLITLIQKIWRGYYVRKIIANI